MKSFLRKRRRSDDVGHGISCELWDPLLHLLDLKLPYSSLFPIGVHPLNTTIGIGDLLMEEQSDAIYRAQFMRNDVIKKGNELRFFLLLAWKIDKRLLS